MRGIRKGGVKKDYEESSLRTTPLEKLSSAPAGVAQRIECQPTNQRVASSIPSQSTCPGCGPGPQLGAHENTH